MTNEEVKRISNDILMKLGNKVEPGEILPNQIFRGVTAYSWESQHPGACTRHMQVFNQYNAIPKYCFDCLKIAIRPRNVIELIKLLFIFNDIKLPNDNTRKCLVETRENVAGTYLGMLYCRDMEEALSISELIGIAVATEISADVPVTIKRGCTEFGIAYPDYAKVIDGKTFMDYRDEWAEYENKVDKDFVVDDQASSLQTHNVSEYSVQDAKAMFLWLMYAATIGDSSYLEISGGGELPALTNVKRPQFVNAQ